MILIDTNIFVYAADPSSQYSKPSQGILYEIGEEIFTTSKNISEFIVVESRMGNDYNRILLAVDEIINHCQILYPSEESMMIFLSLLNRYSIRGKRVHDIEIASIALANNISRIATFNAEDFINIPSIEVIQP